MNLHSPETGTVGAEVPDPVYWEKCVGLWWVRLSLASLLEESEAVTTNQELPREVLGRRHAFVVGNVHMFMCCFFAGDSVGLHLGSTNTQVIIKIMAMNEPIKDEHRLRNNSLGEKWRMKRP